MLKCTKREYIKYVKGLEKDGYKGSELSFKDWKKVQAIKREDTILNYPQVINVCKVCDKCFDKDGCKLENDDGYEVDLFVCKHCKTEAAKILKNRNEYILNRGSAHYISKFNEAIEIILEQLQGL